MAEEGVPDMTLISDMDEMGINRNLQVHFTAVCPISLRSVSNNINSTVKKIATQIFTKLKQFWGV